MEITYGSMPTTRPDGFINRIHWPEALRLDHETPDGRLIDRATFGVADLPFQANLYHDDTVIAGRVDKVVLHDDGRVEAWGWALDDDNGRTLARLAKLQALRSASAELRDFDLEVKFPDFETMFKEGPDGFIKIPKIKRRYTNAKLSGIASVATPAFPNATVEIDDEEEITASFRDSWTVDFPSGVDELTAASGLRVPWDDFHIPEYEDPDGLPLTVDEDNRVFGHLGLWNSCHTGFLDRCVMIPPSRSEYAHFNKSSVLTDRGLVRTGPVFLFGGHPANARPEQIDAAYGGVENAWADVRAVNGRYGVWVSGRVRPGVPEEKVYAARASRVSGHWFNRELFAIASVNAEGFDVPYNYSRHGEDELLVASFATSDCGCGGLDPLAELARLNLAIINA